MNGWVENLATAIGFYWNWMVSRASCEHGANKRCRQANGEGSPGRNRMTEQYCRRQDPAESGSA